MIKRLALALLLLISTACYSSEEDVLAKLDDIQSRLVGFTYPVSMVTNGTYWTEGDNLNPAIPYRFFAKANANRIILFLHSWSGTMSQAPNDFPELAQMDRVVVVSPNFKGVNNTAQALGSDSSIDEIKAVVDRVKYLTGVINVDIIAYSGGTMAAMNFMGKYPGVVRRASLYLPIFDLALLYAGTSDNSLKNDMVAGLGAAPVNDDDPIYVNRSPRARLLNSIGRATVYLNAGTLDTTSPKIHGEQAKAAIELHSPSAKVVYKEWNIGHAITAAERAEMIRQITQTQ